MKLVRIFEGFDLYSVQYPEEELDEYHRLLDAWNDAEYLLKFFETHEKDLTYFKTTPRSAASETFTLATRLEVKVYQASSCDPRDIGSSLQTLFIPLYNNETSVDAEHQRTKVRRKWLRMYAIRISANCFVISGGAIKLTLQMADREHTANELLKIEKTKEFLIDQDLFDPDDFEILEL